MEESVAIILVNYNGYKDTIDCINSLKKIAYKNYSIVVVDNNSTEVPTKNELDYIVKNSIYISSDINLGFSGGNNIGIKWAIEHDYAYILLLNNDTVVQKNFLSCLIKCANDHDDVGIIGGKILYYSEKNKIWYGGGVFDRKTGIADHSSWNMDVSQVNDSIQDVTFITGCLMLIPKNVLMEVGFLEEDYFLYAEDTDYCCRVINKGYRLIYCPESIIYHKVSASTGAESDSTVYYMTRNNLELVRRYCDSKYFIYYSFVKKAIKDILRKRKKCKPVLRGYIDFILRKKGKVEW